MAFAGNISCDFQSIGQANARDFPQRGVRLFRRLRADDGADSALLGRALRLLRAALLVGVECIKKSRSLALAFLALATLADQLIDGRHANLQTWL